MPVTTLDMMARDSDGGSKDGYIKAALATKKDIIVIKVGTSSLVRAEQQTLNLSNLARICETVKTLHSQGHHVIIVTSGAVGVGCQRMGLTTRPAQLAKKQALAAVGQLHLMKFYEDFLGVLGLVLLTLDNLANRGQYLNARNTFTELLAYRAVPVVNENDTVAVQELRIGDNDTLSAQVATLVGADWLFLLTDVDCLYTANPKDDPDATPIYEVDDFSKLQADTSTRGTQWGTGGMATKLTAARIATAAGCRMVICNSTQPERIANILAGERRIGTLFHPCTQGLKGRKRWILTIPVRGALWLDAGAVRAVKDRRKSLFAAGITKITGEFAAQDAVSICDASGQEFARGLVSFSLAEVESARDRSRSSKDGGASSASDAPGHFSSEEVVLRSNLAVLDKSEIVESDDEATHDGEGGSHASTRAEGASHPSAAAAGADQTVDATASLLAAAGLGGGTS